MIPQELPVYKHKDMILQALKEHQVIVVESPTGSGKTTQLPVILHEAGYASTGMIGVTQPRRIATLSVSGFIQRQVEKDFPGIVGYKMRFDDKTSRATRIKIMTDGILLQELKLDWTLSQYNVIMVDEAHERSLNIDFVLGLLKRVLDLRKDFKVIVSSATINAQIFSEYFNNCPIVRIDTNTYPISTIYAPPAKADDQNVIAKITDLVNYIMDEKREGDMLIFLPGEKMIKDCMTSLYSQPCKKKLHIIPLYGRLAKEEQDLVFVEAPRGKTKVVISTNIAETSVTIEGITSVIDSGLSKINFYNPRTYTSSLIEKPISRASANQRKGRAGRTQPGSCYRLYSREDFDSRPLFTQEEIYRTDLSEVVLRMAELGIRNFDSFDFISSPGKAGIAGAVDSLLLLDALNPDNSLSDIGQMMAQFPLLPRHSRIIVEAIRAYPSVLEEAIIGTAFLSCDTPYTLPQGEELEARKAHHAFRDTNGDFVSYLRLFRAFTESDKQAKFCETRYLDLQSMAEIVNVKEQLEQIVSSMNIPVGSGGPIDDYLCSIAKGHIQFICFRTGKTYQSLTAEKVDIHPGSGMYKETPRYIVAGEIVRTSRMYARSVSPLRKDMLHRISPELARHLGDEHSTQRLGKSGISLIAGGKLAAPDSQQLRKATRPATAEMTSHERPQSGSKYIPGQTPVFQDSPDPALTVSIAGRLFPLSLLKGKKKILILEWDDAQWLSQQKDESFNQASDNLRSAIRWEHSLLLEGEKLSRIRTIARYMQMPADIIPLPAAKSKLSIWENLDKLETAIGSILKLAQVRKGNKSEFGFVTLYTNQDGIFWLKAGIGYTTALAESLASLEYLADGLDPAEHAPLVAIVNQQYRKLTEILEAV